MLYTVSRSFSAFDYEVMLNLLTTDDVIVLFQDGVINGLVSSKYWLNMMNKSSHCFALESDVIARGLTEHLSSEIQLIDFNDFVEITVQYFPQIAW